MIYTIMKTTFNKVPPKKVVYRDYKKWSQSKFENELKEKLISTHPSQYMDFEQIFFETLEANAPTKRKVLRANNKPLVNKTLREAIMSRTTLKNIANKTKREQDIRKFKDQSNLVIKYKGEKGLF